MVKWRSHTDLHDFGFNGGLLFLPFVQVSDQLPLLVSCDVQCPILTEQGDILSSPGPDEGFTDFQETTASVADCSDADTLLETGLKNALEKSNLYKVLYFHVYL